MPANPAEGNPATAAAERHGAWGALPRSACRESQCTPGCGSQQTDTATPQSPNNCPSRGHQCTGCVASKRMPREPITLRADARHTDTATLTAKPKPLPPQRDPKPGVNCLEAHAARANHPRLRVSTHHSGLDAPFGSRPTVRVSTHHSGLDAPLGSRRTVRVSTNWQRSATN